MQIADIFASLPTLTTERLILRPLRADDAPDMFDYAADPEVTRYTTWEPHASIADSAQFIRSRLDDAAAGKVAPWGIVRQDQGKLIGTIGYMSWSLTHRKAEIGYAIGRLHWGKGFMTEALQAVLRFGFDSMQLHRISACCDVLNLASARVMQKVGMRFEGTFLENMFLKNAFRDTHYYAILQREWQANHV